MLQRVLSLFVVMTLISVASAAEWTVKDDANTELPGRKVDVMLDGKLVARLIYGEEQMKPYLTVFDDEDALNKWDPKQTYPHHRGIFIGWNKIASNLGGPDKKGEKDPKGTFDLWHFNNKGKMTTKIEEAKGGPDGATIVASNVWSCGNKDEAGSDVLLNEKRTLKISRPAAHKTQVDAEYELTAARDLKLGGDLQHSGSHVRVSAEVEKRQKETSYLWEPANAEKKGDKLLSTEFKWVNFAFPIGEHWYTVSELNAPGNPVEELSTRTYGRTGFFFQKELKKDEKLDLKYRFVFQRQDALKGKATDDDNTKLRAEAQGEYDGFAKQFTK